MLVFFLLGSLLSASFAIPSDTTIDNFKAANAIVPNVNLDLQELRGGGLLTRSAGFIDIDSASPYSVSPGRSATGRLSRGLTSSGQPFLVVRDNKLNIRRVVVRLADGSMTTFRRVDDTFFAEVSQFVSRTIENTRTGNDAKEIPSRLRNLRKEVVRTQQQGRELQTSCSVFYEIEVAIGYDSTFCDDYSNQDEAEATIENIVAEASLHYEQPGVCTQLALVDLEGYCNSNADPYFDMFENGTGASGCSSDGMLDHFGDYWEANKSNVHRDVAHLFQGRDFTDGNVAGCAWIGALCNQRFGYGVNSVSWTWDESLIASLFSHELGHNCAAQHVDLDDTKEYVMEPIVNFASDGFSTASSNTMSQYFSSTTCLAQLPAPTPPTAPQPTDAPVVAPTDSPVPAPSSTPTGAPSSAPTGAPTFPPTPAPSFVSTIVEDSTPEPTASPTDGAADEINGSASVSFRYRPLREDPGEAATAQFVSAAGEMVCEHLRRNLRFYFRDQEISVPSCTYTPAPGSTLTASPFVMFFEFTIRFEESGSRASKRLEVDDAVEQAFVGSAEEELVDEIQSLPNSNPLAESSGVSLATESPEVEEDDDCSILPDFFRAIPILGDLLNALLCMLFGGLFFS